MEPFTLKVQETLAFTEVISILTRNMVLLSFYQYQFSCLSFFLQCEVMYSPNSGSVMNQYPSGVSLAVPMQAGSGMIPIKTVTPGPQGDKPQMAVVPVSGMVGNQPQFAQVATSGAMATAYQRQEPPTYGHGGYTKLENDEFPVNT